MQTDPTTTREARANEADLDDVATLDDLFDCDPWDDEHFGRHCASKEDQS